MDDQEAIRKTRDKFVADRQKLDMMIALLSEQLGESPPPGGGGPGGLDIGFAPAAGAADPTQDPVAATHEGEYFGFTSTKAAGEVLRKFGNRQHPIKTKVIFDAIVKGGVEIGREEALYRSLARSRNFRKVARGTWGLSDWYPERRSRPAQAADNVHALEGEGDEVSEDESTEVDSA